MVHVKHELELDGVDYVIEFDADKIGVGNDGIGAYEFWGAKGIDRGTDYVEEFEINNLIVSYPDDRVVVNKALLEEIKDKIYDTNAVYEKIGEQYFAENEPDYPDEPEYDNNENKI